VRLQKECMSVDIFPLTNVEDVVKIMFDADGRVSKDTRSSVICCAYYVVQLIDRYLRILKIQPILRTWRNVKNILDLIKQECAVTGTTSNAMWTADHEVVIYSPKRDHILELACALKVLHRYMSGDVVNALNAVDSVPRTFATVDRFVRQYKIPQFMPVDVNFVDSRLVKLDQTEKFTATNPDTKYTMYCVMRDVLQRFDAMIQVQHSWYTSLQSGYRETKVIESYGPNSISYHLSEEEDALCITSGAVALRDRSIVAGLTVSHRTYMHANADMQVSYILENGSTIRQVPMGIGIQVRLSEEPGNHVFLTGADPRVARTLLELADLRGHKGTSRMSLVSTITECSALRPAVRCTHVTGRTCALTTLRDVPKDDVHVVLWNDAGRLCKPAAADSMQLLALLKACPDGEAACGAVFSHIRLYLMLQNMTSMSGCERIRRVHNTMALVFRIYASQCRADSVRLSTWKESYVFCIVYSYLHVRSLYEKMTDTDESFHVPLMNVKRGFVVIHPFAFLLTNADIDELNRTHYAFSEEMLRSRMVDMTILEKILGMTNGALRSAYILGFCARVDGRAAVFRGTMQAAKESKHTFPAHIASGEAIQIADETMHATTALQHLTKDIPGKHSRRVTAALKRRLLKKMESSIAALQQYDALCFYISYIIGSSTITMDDFMTTMNDILRADTVQAITQHKVRVEAIHSYANDKNAQMTRVLSVPKEEMIEVRDPLTIPPFLKNKNPAALYRSVRTFELYCDAWSLALHDALVTRECGDTVEFVTRRASNVYVRLLSGGKDSSDHVFDPKILKRWDDAMQELSRASFEEMCARARGQGINVFDSCLVPMWRTKLQRVMAKWPPYLIPYLVECGMMVPDGQEYKFSSGYSFARSIPILQQMLYISMKLQTMIVREDGVMKVDESGDGVSRLSDAYAFAQRLTGYQIDGDDTDTMDKSIREMNDKLCMDNICPHKPLNRKKVCTNPFLAFMYHWYKGKKKYDKFLTLMLNKLGEMMTTLSKGTSTRDISKNQMTKSNCERIEMIIRTNPVRFIENGGEEDYGQYRFIQSARNIELYLSRSTRSAPPLRGSVRHTDASSPPDATFVYVDHQSGDRSTEFKPNSSMMCVSEFAPLHSYEPFYPTRARDGNSTFMNASVYFLLHALHGDKLVKASCLSRSTQDQPHKRDIFDLEDLYTCMCRVQTNKSNVDKSAIDIRDESINTFRDILSLSGRESYSTSFIIGAMLLLLVRRPGGGAVMNWTSMHHEPVPSFVNSDMEHKHVETTKDSVHFMYSNRNTLTGLYTTRYNFDIFDSPGHQTYNIMDENYIPSLPFPSVSVAQSSEASPSQMSLKNELKRMATYRYIHSNQSLNWIAINIIGDNVLNHEELNDVMEIGAFNCSVAHLVLKTSDGVHVNVIRRGTNWIMINTLCSKEDNIIHIIEQKKIAEIGSCVQILLSVLKRPDPSTLHQYNLMKCMTHLADVSTFFNGIIPSRKGSGVDTIETFVTTFCSLHLNTALDTLIVTDEDTSHIRTKLRAKVKKFACAIYLNILPPNFMKFMVDQLNQLEREEKEVKQQLAIQQATAATRRAVGKGSRFFRSPSPIRIGRK
jgi:hypothetical protein